MGTIKLHSLFVLHLCWTLCVETTGNPPSKQPHTLDVLQRATRDVDQVLDLVSRARTHHNRPPATNQLPGPLLVQEELDMLAEDALKLRHKISSAKKAAERPEADDISDLINSIKADSALLHQDANELIGDVRYDNKKVRTITELTFDRDLELLRNGTQKLVADVKTIRPHKSKQKEQSRRGKSKKRAHLTSLSNSQNQRTSDRSQNDDVGTSGPTQESPLWWDPRRFETLHSSPAQPAELTFEKPCNNYLDVTWLSNYLQACPQCTTQVQSDQCPLSSPVMNLKMWAGEVQEILTHGCVKPDDCKYSGTCCIAADVAIEQTINHITALLKHLHNMFQKKCRSCYDADNLGLSDWLDWSPWSSCDVTCGNGRRSRTRGCRGGRECKGENTETERCTGLPDCCVNGNWGWWSSWSACSVSCGEGRRSRNRACNSPTPSSCGQACQGDPQQTEVCTGAAGMVNGNWGSWQAWSECSATCGRGSRTRRRACNDPAPAGCGRTCTGRDEETVPCESGRSCCVNGNWSPWQSWDACSVTCDVGSRQRRRTCANPAPNYCGQRCSGQDLEMIACVTGVSCQTCVNGNWGAWQAWSRCSVTCGRGVTSRRRLCDNPAASECGQTCPGQDTNRQSCETGVSCDVCVNGNWGNWQPWSSCSATCGMGTQTRRRSCDNPPANYCGQKCPGQNDEERSCNSGTACQVCINGNWGIWEAWTSCSVTCGQGRRRRQRSCDNPRANYCGQPCPGQPTEVDTCQTGEKVDGNWGNWQSWSQCSATCDYGMRERLRSCDNPAANQCGRPCPGDPAQTETCDSGRSCIVCVDGNWGSWLSWSTCSVTCGRGVRDRRRSCDSPPANDCGRSCPGQNSETSACDSGVLCDICVDGNWGSWQRWSPCSVTCGRGTQDRRRQCDNPPANYCGQRCPGQDVSRRSCDTQQDCEICVNGNWGTWEAWTSCSVTCGQGRQQRQRSCDNPGANYCGQPCPGQPSEVDTCQTGVPCEICVDGNWGSWEPWSRCSASCDSGMRERQRSCDNPPANRCGRSCPGQPFQTETCDSGRPCVVCIDGNWANWEPWSRCSASCGSGMRERQRSCDDPPANRCGRSCPGQPFQTETCDSGRPCVVCIDGNWGSWQPWSRCSVTCGSGVRDRQRSCNDPPANQCGRSCPGQPFQAETCDSGQPCIVCVDGNWGPWQSWSGCSVSCDRGFRERRRFCDNPPANFCGRECPGQSYDPGTCDTGVPCQVCVDGLWSAWTSWSACSVSCGIGSIVRSRTCSNPAPTSCGKPCPGQTDERVTCRGLGLCDCAQKEWGEWSSWSASSATCGSDLRRRTRTCLVVQPGNDCGLECPGHYQEESLYEGLPPCGPWGQWSSCSVTCRGTGYRERFVQTTVRRGDVPVEIEEASKEVEACQVLEPECPGETWSQWSACSATCRGLGSRERVISSTNKDIGTGQVSVESNATRREVQQCQVTGPECPIWGQWSACSVTCRGRGVRERVIQSTSREVGSGIVLVETDATRRELEDCIVTEPECSYGDAAWSQWGAWCPCDCKLGVRSRTRDCEKPSLGGQSPLKVHTAMCQGDARNVEDCDTLQLCPECITNCKDRQKGDYPSCDSCSRYISCQEDQNAIVRTCDPISTEWDALVKRCVTAPSPSCTLHDCASSCSNKTDGAYHSCDGCDAYVECTNGQILKRACPLPGMEWNQHRKRCESARSPTCKRTQAEDSFGENMYPQPIPRASIPGAGFQDDWSGNEIHHRTNWSSNTSKRTSASDKNQLKVPNCKSDCRNAEEGKYPSCRGCDQYVICTKSKVMYHRRCERTKKWDDVFKGCRSKSSTCGD